MLEKKLLIFDLDGTLIDSRSDLRHAVNHLRSTLGLPPLTLDTVTSYIGDGMRKLVERSLQEHPTDVDQATATFFAYYKQHLWDETTLYDGVEEGLHQLHAAGHTLALMSNKPSDACKLILEHFDLTPLMSSIVGGGDTEHRKPHPEPLLLIMKTLDTDAANTWMIGDNATDLGSARRASTRSVYVTYGMGDRGKETADITCNSFHEVAAHFLKPSS